MKRYLLESLVLAFISSSMLYAGSREKAVTYINAQKSADGSIGNLTPYRDTAEITEMLTSVGGAK